MGWDKDAEFESSVNHFICDVNKSLGKISDVLESIISRLDKLENVVDEPVKTEPNISEIRNQYISECINLIEWDRIHKVMKFLDWHWADAGPNGAPGVPSIPMLKNHAKSYLIRCYENMDKYNEENDGDPDSYSISSGGIKVRTYPDNHCAVYFILTDHDTSY